MKDANETLLDILEKLDDIWFAIDATCKKADTSLGFRTDRTLSSRLNIIRKLTEEASDLILDRIPL